MCSEDAGWHRILDLYGRILEPEGYEVQTSSYFFQQLKDVEQAQPDLVILNFKLGASSL